MTQPKEAQILRSLKRMREPREIEGAHFVATRWVGLFFIVIGLIVTGVSIVLTIRGIIPTMNGVPYIGNFPGLGVGITATVGGLVGVLNPTDL
jgi:hypothetical protein